jgi:hypothetical protein
MKRQPVLYDYTITKVLTHDEEISCTRCGYPMYIDDGILYLEDGTPFCGRSCAKQFLSQTDDNLGKRLTDK